MLPSWSVAEVRRQKLGSAYPYTVVLPFSSVSEVSTPPAQFQIIDLLRPKGSETAVGKELLQAPYVNVVTAEFTSVVL